MKYEYDFHEVPLGADQKQAIEMGLADIGPLNHMIRDIINDKAQDGWEPLYPFSMPYLWFRKQKRTTTRKKNTETS